MSVRGLWSSDSDINPSCNLVLSREVKEDSFPSSHLGVGVFGLAVGVFWRCQGDWGRG